ncbi:MarR family transcriptional regulator [Erythrobacter rubeus]|uniref:MarR family transcriptional regulator n=1 Tax=Erythrobacter rubeus TaxID=2760803 RepID=A0ABR8KVK4_9SPHN|nr:MarR family transcriptional regulator [Erythrobacter rubeus]MBD2842434.1 MarR family transcriptional regulator [Erythrobacter rubeus]
MGEAKQVGEDFRYDIAQDSAGLPARVAIFADRPRMREEIAEDLTGAGFRTVDGGEIAALLDGPITLLGDVVMVDCPVLDGRSLASLARLDMRIARSGAQLIVVTSLDALDDIFAVLDQSRPQILVEPSRAERVVAVGRTLANVSSARVREMSEEDRMALLRLSQQVDGIAQELDRISLADAPASQRLSDHKREFRDSGEPLTGGHSAGPRSAYPPLPDPRMVRQMLAARQARARFFDGELFADPAWDMLLDLTAAHAEHQRVSVTSLCIAAGVPATTALRWVKQMVESGIFERIADRSDKRRAFIALSERSVEAMARYFAEVEMPLAQAA